MCLERGSISSQERRNGTCLPYPTEGKASSFKQQKAPFEQANNNYFQLFHVKQNTMKTDVLGLDPQLEKCPKYGHKSRSNRTYYLKQAKH